MEKQTKFLGRPNVRFDRLSYYAMYSSVYLNSATYGNYIEIHFFF